MALGKVGFVVSRLFDFLIFLLNSGGGDDGGVWLIRAPSELSGRDSWRSGLEEVESECAGRGKK